MEHCAGRWRSSSRPRWPTAARGEASPNGEPLTAREQDVCALVAGGATNREAAIALHMSPRTVEHHLRMAYRKLGVRSRTEMTRQLGGYR